MMMESIAILALVLAAIPAGMFLWNLASYRRLPRSGKPAIPVSVLIPARNEEMSIRAAVESVLQNRDVEIEVVVLDDHSTDATAALVRQLAARDSRVRLESSPALPTGWCGKQHACWILARHARHSLMIFMDADVRLAPDSVRRMSSFMERTGVALASGVPRQVTGTILEKLLIPLIHFVLLGFLPMWRMKRCTKPAYSAGCGQLFIARADAYWLAGGHASIRRTLHDGLKLPRAFRRAGLRTDLFDATNAASCRMYHSGREVLAGLGKNATEGIAAPAMIVPMTVLLLGGQVLPWLLLAASPWLGGDTLKLALFAVGCSLLPRVLAAGLFRQSWIGAILHPLGILLFLGVQWTAFVRKLLGGSTQWKGRTYAEETPVTRTRQGPALGGAVTVDFPK